MKYFAIESSLNEEIMGKIPQIKEFIHHCDVEEESNFIDKFVFEKIEIQPILSNVVLYDNTKQNDLIDAYGHVGFDFGYLISDKIKTILDKFNCYGFQYFKTYIIHKNKKNDNYWQIKKYDFPYQYIDFEKTNFLFKDRDINRNVISNVMSFKNFDEFKLFVEQVRYPKWIFFKDVFFTKEMNLDFFSLRYTDGGHKGIVSKKLKIELEKNEITGIEFRPIEIDFQEWLQGGQREKIYGKS
jgi:hypothetical protein